jgi:hypothetical protein
VTEHHVFVGRDVVEAVVVALGRGLAAVVELKDLLGEELAVEAIGDEVDADRGARRLHLAQSAELGLLPRLYFK